MGTEKDTVVWQYDISVLGESFLGLVQFHSDKTVTKLKSKALIAYPVPAVLLNFCPQWRSLLIINVHAVVKFLPFGNVESRKGFVGDDATSIHGLTSGSAVGVEPFVLLTLEVSGMLQNK